MGSIVKPSTTLRRPAELADQKLVSREALPALEAVAARYAIAITPAVATLIDPNDPNDPTGLLEVTFAKAVAAETAEKKLDRAVRAGHVRRVHGTDWIGDAARLGVISDDEARLLREVEALTARVIAVDHFDPTEVKPHYMTAGHNARAMQSAAAE